jgi:CubicO group peptidase (beta-lactamase class C family)
VAVTAGDPRIRKALDRALELGEFGITLAVYVGEELVVDEWAGVVDDQGTALVGPDTLFFLLSVTKAMTTTALHVQAERGLVEYDAPVARYWPEFAQAGKGDVTVRQILIHQSGASAMPQDVTPRLLNDWEWVTRRLAEMELLHPPGEDNTLHAMNYGWLIGEIVRRTDPQHRLPCQFLEEDVFASFGIEACFSLPPEEYHRAVRLTAEGTVQPTFSNADLRDLAVPPHIKDIVELHTVEQSAAGCHPTAGGLATARGAARFFAILANGGTLGGQRVLSEERLRSFLEPRQNNDRHDRTGGVSQSIGIGGYRVAAPGRPGSSWVGDSPSRLSESSRVATGYADLDTRVAAVVLRNRLLVRPPKEQDPMVALAGAVRDVLVDYGAGRV